MSATPLGNLNSLKHGLYSDALLPGEGLLYESTEVGKLDHEIKITKLRLRRAYIAERQQQELLASDDAREQQKALALDSTDTDTERVGFAEGKITSTKVIRRTTDFGRAIHNLIGQLTRLENQRVLMLGGNELDAAEKARLAREVLRQLNAGLDDSEGDQ